MKLQHLKDHYERELDNVKSKLRNQRDTMSNTEYVILIEKENSIKDFINKLNNLEL